MTSPLLDKLPLSERDKRNAAVMAQELHHRSTLIMFGLIDAQVVDDPELTIQAALGLLLETRVLNP